MALKVWRNTHRHRCASRDTLTLTDWVFQAQFELLDLVLLLVTHRRQMNIFNVLGIRLKFLLLLLFGFLGRDVLTPASFLLLCRHVVKPGFVLSGWRILLLTSSFRQLSFNSLIFLNLCLFLLKLVDFIEVDRAINLLNLHQDSTLFFFSLLLLLLVVLFKFNE